MPLKFSFGIPIPLSETSIISIPPLSIFNEILEALASIELSINSLTTDAGLSTTSPAAIWRTTSSDNLLSLTLFIRTF